MLIRQQMLRRVTVLGGLLTALVSAQPSGAGDNLRASDAAWQSLSVLLSPREDGKPVAKNPSDEVAKSLLQLEIERLQQAAAAARAYYVNYPGTARTPEAKKLEVLCGLQAVSLGAHDGGGAVQGLAQAFRSNRGNPVADRFAVAMALEAAQLSEALNGKRLSDENGAREAVADRLHAEFGATADVCALYSTMLRTADLATAVRVATKIKDLKMPDYMLQEAERTLMRNQLVGRKVELTMETVDGRKIDFSAITETTIVYFWNAPAGLGALRLLERFKSQIPVNVRWVFIGLGSEHPKLDAVKANAPFAGAFCFDSSGLGSAAAAALGVAQPPYVSILSPGGALAAFGRVEELPALIAKAQRK